MDDAHTKTTDEVLLYFKSDENNGLTDEQVTEAQAKYGPNGMYYILIEITYLTHYICASSIVKLKPHFHDQ